MHALDAEIAAWTAALTTTISDLASRDIALRVAAEQYFKSADYVEVCDLLRLDPQAGLRGLKRLGLLSPDVSVRRAALEELCPIKKGRGHKKSTPLPTRYCIRCGREIDKYNAKGVRLTPSLYNHRKYCGQHCANSL